MAGGQYVHFLVHNLACRLAGRCRPLLGGVKLTHACNLRCRACPFWKMGGPPIGLVELRRSLDDLYAIGVRLLIFEGGEPLLWRDAEYKLADILREEQAKRRFFSLGVTTNGTLPLDVPADIVWVSVDGLQPTHDCLRGPVFDKVIANIEASSHPRLLAHVTVNTWNCGELPELVRYLGERVRGITVQFYYPYEGTEDLSLSRDQRQSAVETLIALKHKGYPLLNSVAALRALVDNTWACHPWLLANVEPDGSLTQGCYLTNRSAISCERCGFSAHVELSLAYDWNPQAIVAGSRVFGFR
jgi:MoaA/NifB/PqqE/SkfB family radical SAM enzyme